MLSLISEENKIRSNLHMTRNRWCNSTKSKTLDEINDKDKILTPLTLSIVFQIMPKLLPTIRELEKDKRIFR